MAKKQNTSSKSPKKKTSNKKYLGLFWLLFLAPFLALGLLMFVASISDLPDTEALSNPKTNLATEVYTSDNQVIGRYYRENRSDIKYENLPENIVNALVSTEDVRYFDHSGVDFYSLTRAIAYMGKRGGGSTISQQLSKLLFTKKYETTSFLERALLQKPKEWIISTRLEKQYTKEEIVALYLNRYDFLNQAVGIKSAAHIYFNKPVDSLHIHESAMLVGMLKNSSLYNPLRASRKERVHKRREVVLAQMMKYEFITQAEYDSIRVLPLGINFQSVSHVEGAAPYFREILRRDVKKLLAEKDKDGNFKIAKPDGSAYDLYGDGLKIITTIDSRMQKYAENAVYTHLSKDLQESMDKELKKRKKDKYPFFNDIKEKDRDRILNTAMKQSERHDMLTGKLCPDCKRPGFYIGTITEDGKERFHCNSEKGGCDHKWNKLTEKEIEANFNKATKMKVFSHFGEIDTIMSPLDSIKYHKSFLHAGMLSMDPNTGHIKAWVGGIDYHYFKYDNVNQSRRQVGSTFKPFVYATALRLGLHPCSEFPNQKICVPMPEGQKPWCPENSDFKYGDMVSLKYALANSLNTISARLIKEYGTEMVATTAKDMGIKTPLPNVPSIALGVAELSLEEMVGANSTFVNQGVYIEPVFIQRIEDKNGNTIYEPELNIRQGIDPKAAYLTLEMMKGVVDGAYNRETGRTSGTGRRLRMNIESRLYDNITYTMAGKTGTTQSNADGWFMGLTPDLVTGVWVGGEDPAVRFSSTRLGQGANMALPIYGYYMNDVYKDKSIDISTGNFKKPQGLSIDEFLDCQKFYERTNSVKFNSDGEEELEDDQLFE